MSHWPFIAAAYLLTLAGLLALGLGSFVAMRRAEREADELRRDS
jgi:LPXTG-motif cell wall-anchored protein